MHECHTLSACSTAFIKNDYMSKLKSAGIKSKQSKSKQIKANPLEPKIPVSVCAQLRPPQTLELGQEKLPKPFREKEKPGGDPQVRDPLTDGRQQAEATETSRRIPDFIMLLSSTKKTLLSFCERAVVPCLDTNLRGSWRRSWRVPQAFRALRPSLLRGSRGWRHS